MINSMNFLIIKYNIYNTTIICIMDTKWFNINRFVDVFEKFYIPYIIMLCLDVKSILRLRESKRRVTQANDQNTNRMSKFAVSTILIDLNFLVFRLPETIFQAIQISININQRDLYLRFLRVFSNLISYSYSTALVFIFILFNRIFRKEIFSLFRLNRICGTHFFSSSSTNLQRQANS